MMEETSILKFKITTDSSFDGGDDIKDTITEYGENFIKIENEFSEEVEKLSDISMGNFYRLGKKIWNKHPDIDDYIGWVNIREGTYAPKRKISTLYNEEDLIVPESDNGNVYKCISDGRTSHNQPTFLVSSGVEFFDAEGTNWVSEKNYTVGDIVFPVDETKLFYYTCETSGLSGLSEPSWNNTSVGSTLIDGSVVWRKEKNIKWKQVGTSCNLRPFGKIE